ncbi:DUF7111 family protein [Halalkalicoccus salilacus]|uniref:DUF7111 family protein n=1 Tax=Halalkalicoccus TaxID=332246 RepID=UPI002F967BF0
MAETNADGIVARYHETDAERVIEFERDGRRVQIAQNRAGYAMLMVRDAGDELERYYGFEMALDHAAELLETDPSELPIPDDGADMGM